MAIVQNKNKGFTLIEVLIAIAILAIVSTQSYLALKNMLVQKQVIEENLHQFKKLQRTILIMERDFLQMAPSVIRDAEVGHLDAMMSDGSKIEFTRAGRPSVVSFVSSIFHRVGYYVKEGKLVRQSWDVTNRSSYTKPNSVILLENVATIRFRFYEKDWGNIWPPNSQSVIRSFDSNGNTALPKALRFEIETKKHGNILRIIPGSS